MTHRIGFAVALVALFALAAAGAYAIGSSPRSTAFSALTSANHAVAPAAQIPTDQGWPRFIVTDIQVRPATPTAPRTK